MSATDLSLLTKPDTLICSLKSIAVTTESGNPSQSTKSIDVSSISLGTIEENNLMIFI